MKWLEKVAEHHEDYLEIVRKFGEQFLAEDIVQEMYIKLSKYCTPEKIIRKDGQVNKSYVYFVLRNLFLDYQKEKNKHWNQCFNTIKAIGKGTAIVLGTIVATYGLSMLLWGEGVVDDSYYGFADDGLCPRQALTWGEDNDG